MLPESQLRKNNVPGGLNLYLTIHMFFFLKRVTQLTNRKCTLFISSSEVYLYHICIFIFSICYLCLLFFILRKNINLEASFTLKEHTLTEKTDPIFQHFFIKSHLLNKPFLVFLESESHRHFKF